MVFSQASRLLARRFSTTVARRGDWQQEGIPGATMPYPTQNRAKMTAAFVVYFASGYTLPFLMVRYQMLKNQ